MSVQQDLLREAAQKESLARDFDGYVKELADVFNGIPTTPERSAAVWKGQAADRYTAQGRQLHLEIVNLGESCAATARNLRRRAQQLREEAAQARESP
ncbi:hypothetical protein ACIBQX_41230 [Nonomuraea sp. NPDC049714]|uniref:hypothetical protein n=1 Tax=Nonomuraea sp. NPDC049714 TaxID=3364357 RepID=UPI0037ADE609